VYFYPVQLSNAQNISPDNFPPPSFLPKGILPRCFFLAPPARTAAEASNQVTFIPFRKSLGPFSCFIDSTPGLGIPSGRATALVRVLSSPPIECHRLPRIPNLVDLLGFPSHLLLSPALAALAYHVRPSSCGMQPPFLLFVSQCFLPIKAVDALKWHKPNFS